MKFPSTIYTNPIVPIGYYWAKVTDFLTEDVEGMDRPRVWVELELGPMHEEHEGKRFCVIIHPSEAARFIHASFLTSFRVSGQNYAEAIGRWASIQLYPAEYEGSQYSAVRFCQQLPQIRRQVLLIEEAERRFGRVTEETMVSVGAGE